MLISIIMSALLAEIRLRLRLRLRPQCALIILWAMLLLGTVSKQLVNGFMLVWPSYAAQSQTPLQPKIVVQNILMFACDDVSEFVDDG